MAVPDTLVDSQRTRRFDTLARAAIAVLGGLVAMNAIQYASYNTPGEDDMPWFWLFHAGFVTIPIVGLGVAGARGWLDRLLLVGGYVAAVSPSVLYGTVTGEESIMVNAGLLLILLPLILAFAALPATIVWALAKGTRHQGIAYTSAVALLPTMAVLTVFGFPELDRVKWTQPWTALQPELVAFQLEATAAVRQLGLSTSGRWTDTERDRFERAFQNRREFVTPTGHSFIARAIQFNDPEGEIYLYWGSAFGRVNIRGLTVVTASD